MSDICSGMRIGEGVLVKDSDPDHLGYYVGDVNWFGFQIGVRISRFGENVKCEFFDRPKPDWAAIPLIDGPEPELVAKRHLEPAKEWKEVEPE